MKNQETHDNIRKGRDRMTTEIRPKPHNLTSPLCGWLALFTATTWYFSVYQSYNPTLYSRDMNMFWFSIAFAIPIIALSLAYSNNIKAISRIFRYTMPVGIVFTATMALLPEPWFVALFIASGPVMAPLAIRSCYDAVRSAKPAKRMQTFMSAITAAIFVHASWLLIVQSLGFTPFVQFLFPTVVTLASYALLWRHPSEQAPRSGTVATLRPPTTFVAGSQPTLFYIIFVFLVVFVFDLSSDLFHTYFLTEGLTNDILLFIGGIFLPAICLTLYAVLADRKQEKKAILVGMSLYLLGLVLALSRQEATVWPLIIADGIGGAYADFFVVGFSLLFFSETDKPVLMASLGLALDVLTASFLWTVDAWLPASLIQGFGTGNIVVMAVLTILLLVTAMLAFDRQNEKNIVLAIFRLRQSEAATMPPHKETLKETVAFSEPTSEALPDAGFSQREREVASLLIEGYTQGEIARRLHLPAGKVGGHLKHIRDKVNGVPTQGVEAALERVVKDFALTKRESQTLRSLVEGRTNSEIAAELFISEETVKFHVRNLMKKLPIEGRRQVASWLANYKP